MKKILLISNEETPNALGCIHGETYGLEENLYNITNLQNVLHAIGDFEVHLIHHTQIAEIAAYHPDYVILSGRFSEKALDNHTLCDEYKALIDWIRSAEVPILGICLGLQLICAAFGAQTARMEQESGEYGWTALEPLGQSPLLQGVPSPFFCLELHRCEVANLPDDFTLLARSAACRNQMIVHKTRPIAATQFHPELITADQKDGWEILKQFFRVFAS